MVRDTLPQLAGALFLTDSGIETDLIFNYGQQLPEFAAFVLLDTAGGRAALEDYFARHVVVAERYDCGLILEAPTWRASRSWAVRLGLPSDRLNELNATAMAMLTTIRQAHADSGHAGGPIVISGCLGPRDDAYNPAETMTVQDAEDYHREQIEILAATDADLVHAMTITTPQEAVGIARAAARAAIPVAISFTTETDGSLPDGSTLQDAILTVDAATDNAPVYYGINCAHPTHFATALTNTDLSTRIHSLRANASRKSHAELDESDLLDDGDPEELAASYQQLRAHHPQLTILGGCCGTDVRHIEAIANACLVPPA